MTNAWDLIAPGKIAMAGIIVGALSGLTIAQFKPGPTLAAVVKDPPIHFGVGKALDTDLFRVGGDLIKPQFEVGREHIGGGGVVTDDAAIARASAEVVDFMETQGFRHRLSLPSPIAGGDGNRETVALFTS